MGRKKELIITILILATVLFLALFEPIKEICSKNNDEIIVSAKQEYITVKITGEVIEEKSFTIPKGSTYAYVIKVSKGYLNEYSYIDIDEKNQINKNCSITFKSKDFNNTYYVETSDKVSINQGSFAELITIYGIGEKRATKIISARKTKAISSYDELRNIIGVSNEVLERIKASSIL